MHKKQEDTRLYCREENTQRVDHGLRGFSRIVKMGKEREGQRHKSEGKREKNFGHGFTPPRGRLDLHGLLKWVKRGKVLPPRSRRKKVDRK